MANLLGAKEGPAGEEGAKVSDKGDGMGGTVLKADGNGDESLGRTWIALHCVLVTVHRRDLVVL